MKTKSIRFRLTFWYTISLVLAIIVIFASFYFITRQVLHDQTDSSLKVHSNKIVEIITSQNTGMHDAIAREAFVEEFSNIPGMLVVVMNSSGMIVSSSQTVSPTDSVIRDLFAEANQSQKPFFTDRRIGTSELRFLVNPIAQNNSLLGVVIMGHPIDVIKNALNSLITMLGVVFAIFLVPAVLGGYFNARAAVSPISDISKKLKLINSGNLSERIRNPNTGDEIEELSVTFNSLLDRLGGAFQRERQFIGDVAHEVKTPLSAQRTNIEVALARDRSKEDYQQALEESLVDNNRLSTTLKNVLDLAWSEADAARTQFENFDLSELVQEMMDLGTKMAVKKQISVDGSIEQHLLISGKKDKLERALINLVDNAIKYTPDKGTVTISLQKKRDQAQFKVKDTGRGISVRDLPHVFERFYRGSRTDKTFGSGLGLSITSAIVSAHRGEIRAKSQIGKGSEFIVLLPLSSS
ncbi:HAMP domain-containing protein [Candidatus Daviesbacteria bacterium]|nr:HAMP domain-containing protein [Candidatus Daviesbacteria bacterium]